MTAFARERPPRTWTDTQQRKLEAAFVRVEGTSAVLQLADGTESTVPLASLSAADRAWIAAQTAEDLAAANRPAALTDWPRTVTLPTTPAVKVVREDPQKKEFIYETEHYEFVCDSPLGANLVREFSRIFEATWLLNCLLPLDFKPAPEPGRTKFRARIFTSEADYAAAGGPPGSAGVYMFGDRELKLPLSSLGVKMFGSRVTIDYAYENYSTLIHEITHQMMCHWIGRLPLWYAEGSAVYVEIAKYSNGRFSFLQPEKRLRDWLAPGGGSFRMVPLERLMNLKSAEWIAALGHGGAAAANYASACVLTFYFYHLDGDGKGTHFKEFLRAVEKLPPRDDVAPLVQQHLLRGRSYVELQRDVQKAMRREGVMVEFGP